jgi:TonB family protein
MLSAPFEIPAGKVRLYLGVLRLIAIALTVIPVYLRAAQSRDNDAAAWVQKASDKTNIRADGTPAFDLRAHMSISVASNTVVDGTYRLIWNSPSQWREEVHLPEYDRVRIGGPGVYWQRRSVPYESVRVWQLDKLLANLSHLELLPGDKLGKGHERKVQQEKLNCADVINESGFHRIESCFDQTSGALRQVSGSSDQALDGLTQMEYSDYQDWSGKSFPRSVLGFNGKMKVVEFDVDALDSAQQAPPATFATLPDDKKWTQCEKPDKLSILEQARPQYPPEARAQSKQGTVAIYVVIEATGEISHEKVVLSIPALDAAAFDAVSHWKYKAPTCQGTPYSLEKIITVAFRIGN